ncbi:hypothetical protein BgiMline_003120 [Biomphalaria glabrata]|uniref:Uncharacterized protein LOC106062848 n=1 Tax=Biomphalaria glabrata TaxID=6526 RepID=A0A2C9LGM3_BIOGL|nr:uncharacterized protein LOC106062848 [Biomphalaria glabrata]KAI8755602.1 hypothetical protein BgiMline_011692 [Biomphalaria glabrata]KAI8793123.1 hypothetical protein BgiBS90_006112 [Biomphalaria glabrata]
MLTERNITLSDETTSTTFGEEMCVMKYRLYYSTEIKNITFHCDNGCCGRLNKQYCCLSTPAFLGFIMTTAIVGFLCLAAVSNYVLNKCDKHLRFTKKGVDKKTGPSVPGSPVYRPPQWTTANSGVPLPQYSCVPPQPYSYANAAGYGYPMAPPYSYMGATAGPQVPLYPNVGPYEAPKPPVYPNMLLAEDNHQPAQAQVPLVGDQQLNPPAYPGTLPPSAPVGQHQGAGNF